MFCRGACGFFKKLACRARDSRTIMIGLVRVPGARIIDIVERMKSVAGPGFDGDDDREGSQM